MSLSPEFFVSAQQRGGPKKPRIVSNPPQRKVVKVGEQYVVETVEAPQSLSLEDWIDEREVENVRGPLSGFGRFLAQQGVDADRWALGNDVVADESYLPVTDIVDGPRGVDKRALRVTRDRSGVPNNFAAIDRKSESDAFFGAEKPDEMKEVAQRRDTTVRERGGLQRVRPLRVIRR